MCSTIISNRKRALCALFFQPFLGTDKQDFDWFIYIRAISATSITFCVCSD